MKEPGAVAVGMAKHAFCTEMKNNSFIEKSVTGDLSK